MATPTELIQKQHEEGLSLLSIDSSEYCPCAERHNHGEIPLTAKRSPTTDRPSWSSRGQIDVTSLQEIVGEGYNVNYHSNDKTSSSTTNLWHPVTAAQHNVSVCRPSHDQWGIGKIVLIFCDDFLQQCYHFPFWHLRADIREAVQPVLDVLQIQVSQCVRLLLASLPPQTTIPLHQDSGEWVHQTHRVHVPILVLSPEDILFRSGPDDVTLQRIDCHEGHVFEINNAQRHAVTNGSSEHYRVHLILDYMDQPFRLPPVVLTAGEVLYQTRRSLNRVCDQGSRPTPSFMILGAQKAGTTSLYQYLTQHDLVIPAKRRETHCLDWRWNEQLKTVEQQREWCQKFYHTEELYKHAACLTGDSTPSYLLDSRRVIPRIQAVFNWPLRFFVMVREPVARAESHYAMVTSPEGTEAQLRTRGVEWRNKSLWQVVQEDLQQMHACGLLPHWNIEKGMFDANVWKDFSGSAAEDQAWSLYLERHVPLKTGSYGLLARGLYELQLRSWLKAFPAEQFLVLVLERDLADTESVHRTMERVWAHLGIPGITSLDDTTAQNTREYKSFLEEENEEKKEEGCESLGGTRMAKKEYLQRFFQPYNERLAQLMEQHGWGSHKWNYGL
jgi:hypothetical protein